MPTKYEYYRELGLYLLQRLVNTTYKNFNFHYVYHKEFQLLVLFFSFQNVASRFDISCKPDELPIFLYEILKLPEVQYEK